MIYEWLSWSYTNKANILSWLMAFFGLTYGVSADERPLS